MLNPSTADATIDDLTIKRCMGFVKSFGYGRLVVGNLFAFRTTYPTELRIAAKPEGSYNLRHLKTMCEEAHLVIAAWGEDGTHLGQDEKILALLKEWAIEVHALKLTKKGFPRHPSRLSASLTPQLWK
jgi:hypothetical protein